MTSGIRPSNADPVPISILDRSHLSAGSDQATALLQTIVRAQHAEGLGYKRFWVSEHHGVPGVAGAAPAVLIAAFGAKTQSIRVGSGGVMVPNHQPLVIVEQFGTLAALYPGRIDLGLGRSLGFVAPVRRALRRETYDLNELRSDLTEISALLQGTAEVTAYPGTGADIPLFVLASSSSAIIAAEAGMALVIGGPKVLTKGENGSDGATIIDRYREAFAPSPHAALPYVVLNVNVLLADTEAEAADLARSEAWAYVASKIQGEFPPLESPSAIHAKDLTVRQRGRLATMAANTITGTPERVIPLLTDLVEQTGADEVLISGSTFDPAAALHSDALLAQGWGISPP